MAELDIHHEAAAHATDPLGKRVGIMAAILAVFLAIVTIASHRAHTAAIIHQSKANDAWAYYQATRVKFHNVELGENLARVFGGNTEAARKMLDDYSGQKKKYDAECKEIEKDAEAKDHAAETDEERAVRYDIGEAFLEISVVLTSLYFVARRRMFPVLGIIAGLVGLVFSATGLML
jgi:hypothetical protein